MSDIPAELLAIARQVRETFGDGVRLKYAAWEGGSAGNPVYDDPCHDPRDSLKAKQRAGDVVEWERLLGRSGDD